MKVWIVEWSDWDGSMIEKVFINETLANDYIINSKDKDNLNIHEYEIIENTFTQESLSDG